MGLTMVVNLLSSTRMRASSEGCGQSVYREMPGQALQKCIAFGFSSVVAYSDLQADFASEARTVSSLILRFKLSIAAGWVLMSHTGF